MDGNDGLPGPDRLDQLVPNVYQELRRLAEQYMRRERGDHTLQPTALVHEVYLRLNEDDTANWRSRSQFFAAAAEATRRILIEHARKHRAIKRGGNRRRVTLDDALCVSEGSEIDLLELDHALTELGRFDQRMARVIELRFFGGLTVEEVAEVLGLSKRTIENDWTLARAWMRRQLREE